MNINKPPRHLMNNRQRSDKTQFLVFHHIPWKAYITFQPSLNKIEMELSSSFKQKKFISGNLKLKINNTSCYDVVFKLNIQMKHIIQKYIS